MDDIDTFEVVAGKLAEVVGGDAHPDHQGNHHGRVQDHPGRRHHHHLGEISPRADQWGSGGVDNVSEGVVESAHLLFPFRTAHMALVCHQKYYGRYYKTGQTPN